MERFHLRHLSITICFKDVPSLIQVSPYLAQSAMKFLQSAVQNIQSGQVHPYRSLFWLRDVSPLLPPSRPVSAPVSAVSTICSVSSCSARLGRRHEAHPVLVTRCSCPGSPQTHFISTSIKWGINIIKHPRFTSFACPQGTKHKTQHDSQNETQTTKSPGPGLLSALRALDAGKTSSPVAGRLGEHPVRRFW